MAKAKADSGESRSRIFTRYFTDQKDLLKQPGFDAIIEKYKAEFPDREFTAQDRQIAANIKSKLRREFGIRRRRRRAAAAVGASTNAGTTAPRAPRTIGSLTTLEEQIDDCLMAAKRLDREGLDDVIRHLRRARNLIVVRLGGEGERG